MKQAKKEPDPEVKKLQRLPDQGMVTGVAAGVADYFKVDPTLVRVGFIIAVFASGGYMILAYIIMAIIIPTPNKDVTDEKIKSISSNLGAGGSDLPFRNWLGLSLVLLGSWLLFVRFMPSVLMVSWRVLWPAMIILLGLFILLQKEKNND